MEWRYRARSSSSSQRWGSAPQASKDDSDDEPQANALEDEVDWQEASGEDSGAQEHADEINAEPPANAIEDEVDGGESPGEDSGAQEHADEIKAIGFALVQSAAMLPELAIPKGPRNCIDCATFDTMRRAITDEDVKALEETMQRFFTRRPVLQSTPPRADSKAARVLKTRSEIANAWRLILERRRLVELDDTCPITDPDTLADMYTSWMHEWLDENLTEKQCRLKGNQQSSIFAAYLNNNLGARHFVMALWQTGVQWAPPPAMLNNDHNGALEHVAKNFAKWTQKLARAVTLHKKGWWCYRAHQNPCYRAHRNPCSTPDCKNV
jgi:hypothetical protein